MNVGIIANQSSDMHCTVLNTDELFCGLTFMGLHFECHVNFTESDSSPIKRDELIHWQSVNAQRRKNNVN